MLVMQSPLLSIIDTVNLTICISVIMIQWHHLLNTSWGTPKIEILQFWLFHLQECLLVLTNWYAMTILLMIYWGVVSTIYSKGFDVNLWWYLSVDWPAGKYLNYYAGRTSGLQNVVQNGMTSSGAIADSNALLPWSLFPTQQFTMDFYNTGN